MRQFDYSFLETTPIPPVLVGIICEIDKLQAQAPFQMQQMKQTQPDAISKLKAMTQLQVLQSLNNRDNIPVFNKWVERVNDGTSELHHFEQKQFAGYKDARLFIQSHCVDFCISDVLKIHELLQGYVKYTGGCFMDEYKAEQMELLTQAYKNAAQNETYNKLILISCVISDFLYLNPMAGVNERTALLLAYALFLKYGYSIINYSSFEKYFYTQKVNNADLYSDSLFDLIDVPRYMNYAESFLRAFLACCKDFSKKFISIDGKLVSKQERIKAEIITLIPDATCHFIEDTLSLLLKNGTIHKIGSNRTARYVATIQL